MKKYGGTLIENSDEGVYKGLQMLYNGEIKPIESIAEEIEKAAEINTLC